MTAAIPVGPAVLASVGDIAGPIFIAVVVVVVVVGTIMGKGRSGSGPGGGGFPG